MKGVWQDQKFSFIHEARPTDKNLAFFVQTLYDRAISHMVGQGPLSKRLAGLYALYCLYETQLFEQPFKIYLSLKDLEKLNSLVIEAKKKNNDMGIAVIVVKKMLEKCMFLFGFIQMDEEFVSKIINDIRKKQDCYLQAIAKTLLSNVPAQEHCHMNLVEDVKLGELRNLAKEYVREKELVIMEASSIHSIGELLNSKAEHQEIVGEDYKRLLKDGINSSTYFMNKID